jgi:hypothetical protein
MTGIVTKGGVSLNLGGSRASGGGSSMGGGNLKYRRRRFDMTETVDQVSESISYSLKQSRAQKDRMGEIK